MVADQELTLGAVGDIMLKRPLDMLCHSSGVKFIQGLTGAADISVANLEMALTNSKAAAEKLSVIGSKPQLISQVSKCGFDAVTLANNHIMDYGIEGLTETLKTIDEAGLFRLGAGYDLKEAVSILNLKSSRKTELNLVNLACTLPTGSAAGVDRPGVAPIRVTQQYRVESILVEEQPGTSPWVDTFIEPQDSRLACEVISRAASAGVRVVAVIHWGIPPYWHAPFQGNLAAYQRPLARQLIRAGADAVIGHHPHVLHGIEVIEGCPVFYSLGNFIWHSRQINLTKNNEPGYQSHWKAARTISAADPLKRESVFLFLTWKGSKWWARLIPVCLNENGEPESPDIQKALNILTRLKDMSMGLGCTLEIINQEAILSGGVKK